MNRLNISFSYFFLIFSIFIGVAGSLAADTVKLSDRATILKEFESGTAQFSKGFAAPIEKYFAAHETEPSLEACRVELKAKRLEYREARRKEDYKRMETLMIGAAQTKGMIKLLKQCGPCTSRVEHEAGSGVYFSDGWCRIPSSATDGDRARALINGIDFLKKPSAMEKRNGGFNHIMTFSEIKKSLDGYLAFIVVKANSFSGFSYFGQSTYENREKDPVQNFVLEFKSVPEPSDFDEPEIPELTIVEPLQKVEGQWYGDAEGNWRYKTSADFGFLGVLELKDTAEQVMMDTVYSLLERVYPEPLQ